MIKDEKETKNFVTIELSISLLRLREDSHGKQIYQRVLALTMQFAYKLCIAEYDLLSAAQH